MTRRFTSELLPIIGPKEDIPAPDMATNEQTMAWMMDTYSMQSGYAVPEIVTGSRSRSAARCFGTRRPARASSWSIARACDRLGWSSPSSAASCRDSGTSEASPRPSSLRWARRSSPSPTSREACTRRAGLDIAALHEYVRDHGSLEGCEAGTRLSNDELLELDCDILVLAAREDQVTADNAPRIRARMIAEGANGPTSLEADAILWERGIPVLPDILTNAGGVTVSYFEWVQDLGRLFWTRDEIRAKLAEKLSNAFDRVWDIAENRDVKLRTGALVAGIREVSDALQARGIFP